MRMTPRNPIDTDYAGSATVTISYDALGRRTSLTLPNAVVLRNIAMTGVPG